MFDTVAFVGSLLKGCEMVDKKKEWTLKEEWWTTTKPTPLDAIAPQTGRGVYCVYVCVFKGVSVPR